MKEAMIITAVLILVSLVWPTLIVILVSTGAVIFANVMVAYSKAKEADPWAWVLAIMCIATILGVLVV